MSVLVCTAAPSYAAYTGAVPVLDACAWSAATLYGLRTLTLMIGDPNG